MRYVTSTHAVDLCHSRAQKWCASATATLRGIWQVLTLISADRFLVRSTDHEAWLRAREGGITATQVARAATPKGYEEELARMADPTPIEPNAYMAWGSEREAYIALAVKDAHGVMPNDWLITAGASQHDPNRWMLATPDGLSLDHELIGEYKTGGKPHTSIPIHYRRQMQWQMAVTGASACVYAYEQRLGVPGAFYPAFDIHMEIVERDDKEIAALRAVAERLQQHACYMSEAA